MRLVRRRAEQIRCKRSLAEFARRMWAALRPQDRLEWGWHLQAVCDHFQWQLEDRARAVAWLAAHPDHVGDLPPEARMRAQDFAINVPQRTLKSTLATLADAWSWVLWPEDRKSVV